MMRLVAIGLIGALASCSPRPTAVETTDIVPCAETEFSGALEEGECQIEAAGQVLHVKFAPLAADGQSGNVSIDVLGEDNAVIQTLLEPDVSEYRAPTVQDIDGDGRADLLIPHETGNVNTSYGVWVFNGERNAYERVGDVSGVSIERTSDGLIAVPARGGAALWSVVFYKLDQGGLHPMVTLNIEARDGQTENPVCTVEDAPGLADLHLTEQGAHDRFCAEPAAQVFE